MDNNERCPGCGYYKGHFYKCPNLTMEEMRGMIEKYSQEMEAARVRYNKWATHMTNQLNIAKYKFMTVKHENNQLRKKIYPGK
jgi:hypothetical protein